jgi:hypothetical protein
MRRVRLGWQGRLRLSVGLMFEIEEAVDDSSPGSFGSVNGVVSGAVPRAVFKEMTDGTVDGTACAGPKAVFKEINDGAPGAAFDAVGSIVRKAALEVGCDGTVAEVGTLPFPVYCVWDACIAVEAALEAGCDGIVAEVGTL